MKRFISLFLVFAMLFIMAVPAFAVRPMNSSPPPFPSGDLRPAISPNQIVNYTTVDGVRHTFYYTSTVISEKFADVLYEFFVDNVMKVSYNPWNNYASNPQKFSYGYVNELFLDISGGRFYFNFGCYSDTDTFFWYMDDAAVCFKYLDIPYTAVFDELPPAEAVPDFGEDKTNGFFGDYGCKILLPRNGFKQSKLNAIVLKTYYKIPFDGDINKVKIKVTGYIGDKQVVNYHKINKLNNNTVLEGYLDFSGAVSWNVLCPITLTITDYTGKEYTSSVKVLCYDDFVDKNNDGKDDRTNDDEWTGNPDFNKPIIPDNSLPAGAGVTDWFKWFFGNVGSFFETIKSGFSGMVSLGGDFVSFLGVGFSYIPKEIFTILGFGFAIMIFLRIFGR